MVAAAPQIPGLTYERVLGSGGYADVFLYEDHALKRKVAVKILRDTNLDASVVKRFAAEANAMAKLEHPYIVPVYSIGTTPDNRAFITMVYYPLPTMAERARERPFAVSEAVRVGIQIGSAVETAHRARLLHRDIKPANILTNQYGQPGLTDFGIAAEVSADDEDELGVSVPWSPPETLYSTSPASAASDVYSMSATLWHLLVGRSPFEISGGDNQTFGLMRRIRDIPPPSTGRHDVPESLDRLLKLGMAKEPRQRPASMMEFIRSLQAIEQEARYDRTELSVLEGDRITAPLGSAPVNDRTIRRSSQLGALAQPRSVAPRPPEVAPHPPEAEQRTTRKASTNLSARGGQTVSREPEATVHRALTVREPSSDSTVPEPQPGRARSRRLAIGALSALTLAVAVGVGVVLSRPDQVSTASVADAPTDVAPPLVDAIPPGPVTVSGIRKGEKVTFTWDYSASRSADTYRWQSDGGKKGTSTAARITITSAKPVCLQVKVVRADGSNPALGWSPRGCVD